MRVTPARIGSARLRPGAHVDRPGRRERNKRRPGTPPSLDPSCTRGRARPGCARLHRHRIPQLSGRALNLPSLAGGLGYERGTDRDLDVPRTSQPTGSRERHRGTSGRGGRTHGRPCRDTRHIRRPARLPKLTPTGHRPTLAPGRLYGARRPLPGPRHRREGHGARRLGRGLLGTDRAGVAGSH